MNPVDDDYDEIDSYLYHPINLIEAGLYLGNLSAAENSELIRSYNITKILSLLDNFSLCKTIEEVEYLRIEINDSMYCNIVQYLPDAISFISKALKNGENVLVHCAAGISRSPSIVIAFVMVKYNMQLSEAFELVRSKRKCIWPNDGFKRQLGSISIDDFKIYL